MIINLCGYATSGKDAFADALVKNHGYVKMGWADRLYKMALVLNPRIYFRGWYWSLESIVKKRGWTKAKEIPAVRKYLQFLGTEVVRECLGEDAWVNAMEPDIVRAVAEGKNVVITNTRFRNEAVAVNRLNGYLVRIDRPGVGPVNSHKSDSGEVFGMAQTVIPNDGTLQQLECYASLVHESLAGQKKPAFNPITAEVASNYMEQIQLKALGASVEAILSVRAPELLKADHVVRKNRVEIIEQPQDDSDDYIYTVMVNGVQAGEIEAADDAMYVVINLTR